MPPTSHDPSCPLCPGNVRASGETNPRYETTYVFANDFSALIPDAPHVSDEQHPLLHVESARGVTQVICYSPDHALTLAEMPARDIESVVDAWIDVVAELGAEYPWVQVFENKGEAMGCSQPHPHGQAWASSFVPDAVARKDERLHRYHDEHGRNLLLDYLEVELADGARVVEETAHWVALVPFWAGWPFETMLLPKDHVSHLTGLSQAQRHDLALALRALACRYDNLFECSFPYRWAGTSRRVRMAVPTVLTGSCTPVLSRRCCARPRCASSWWATSCSAEAQRDLTAETPPRAACRVDVHYGRTR